MKKQKMMYDYDGGDHHQDYGLFFGRLMAFVLYPYDRRWSNRC